MAGQEPDGDFDAIVVGSGFGGAVAAARLAQAGLHIAVLERGQRWPRGSFPRAETRLTDGWLWHRGRGLYDVRWLDRMVSVQGAGWGGGSLVYANVFARPSEETFRPHWPDGYSRSTLDRYYDLAAHMLEVRPVQPDPATGQVPLRTQAMEALVAGMDHAAGSVRPNLAVRFSDDPDRASPNRHGVPQHGCTFVGECVLGCNQGAKNSLDYNYLAVAERAGAVARTRCEVVRIAPTAAGYAVTYRDHADDGAEHELRARTVFLAAGSVGTTELLLRARDVDATLPQLSRRLGEGFSGNGDYLTVIRRARTRLDAERGPTITTTSIVDFDETEDHQVWFQVQDGNYPAVLARVAAGVDPTRRVRAGLARALPGSRRPRRPAPLALLLMGRDTSQGRLVLDHNREAALDWDNRANRYLYVAEGQVGRAVAKMLGGRAFTAPTWSLLRRAVTVHNLGGAPMGADAAAGVIDEHGEVHGYPGLFVVDGAAVPSATGVNPSASILAMAERNVEQAVRRLIDDPEWQAPEMADVVPTEVPEDEAMRRMAERRRARSGNGVRFAEVLTGELRTPDGVRAARLRLTAGVTGMASFLRDPVHPLSISGRLDVAGAATDAEVSGTLELFPDAGDVAMRYRLTGTDDRGDPLVLMGTKSQHPRNPLWLWSDLTTLQVESSVGSGRLTISPLETTRLATSIRGQAFTWRKRRRAEGRFLLFFARGAVTGLGWTRRRPAGGSPDGGPR